MKDPCTPALAALHSWAASSNRLILEASHLWWEEPHSAIQLDSCAAGQDSWAAERFIQACEHIDADLMVLEVGRFEEDDLDNFRIAVEAIEEYESERVKENRQDEVETLGEIKKLREAVAAAKQYLGFVCYLCVTCWHSAKKIRIVEEWSPEWWQYICEIQGDTEDGDDASEERQLAWEQAQAENDRWTAPHRTEAARRIANDSRFPKAKTEAARIHLTRDVMGEEVPHSDQVVLLISREAKAIYDFEVKHGK